VRARIKVCGVTRVEDALAAEEAGADAVGFMFFRESRRCVTVARAAEISKVLGPWIGRVGVFVNADAEEIRRVAGECGLDSVQLHGEETPEDCERLRGLRRIKAFRVKDAGSLRGIRAYRVEAQLLDTHHEGSRGGVGQVFDWGLAVAAAPFDKPTILAGGLTAENVGEALRRVRPYGVDVSSGVETRPGEKDAGKMRRFARAVAEACAGMD
jgi:phosphoribosylanthranilate isomerase